MSPQATYLLVVSMDVDPEHENTFNDVYDNEHVPFLSQVPGVLSIKRCQREELTINIGGERQTIHLENEPKYTAIYELERADVLTSDAWNQAVERGRWPQDVRPYTKNRRHVLLKVTSPKA